MNRLNSCVTPIVAISKAERVFFVELGTRIAQLRKDQGITQVQLAQWLDTSQQTITAYESGRRRVPVSTLPTLARTLGVSVEELIGESAQGAAKRGPAPKLQQQLERITKLPKAQQRFVMQMLDTVIQQAAR